MRKGIRSETCTHTLAKAQPSEIQRATERGDKRGADHTAGIRGTIAKKMYLLLFWLFWMDGDGLWERDLYIFHKWKFIGQRDGQAGRQDNNNSSTRKTSRLRTCSLGWRFEMDLFRILNSSTSYSGQDLYQGELAAHSFIKMTKKLVPDS